MSWEEYKNKKKQESSWEQYKQKRQANATQNTVTTKSSTYNKTSLWDTVKNWATNDGKYIAKKTGAGVATGSAGIAQGQLTDIADNLRQGEDKSGIKLTTNLLKSLTSIGNPSAKLTKATPEQIKKVLVTAFDKDKSSVEKATGLITGAVSDAMNNSSDVSDAMLNIAGKINNNLDEKTLAINDAISAPINKMNQKLEEEGQNYGTVTNFLANAGQSIGNMTPSLVAYGITKNPNISLGTMALSVKGQATQEALNKGAELEEAVKIGDTKALIEVGTEKLFGGINIFGKGTLDDAIEKTVLDKVKNNVAKFFVKQGIDGGSEVAEELISDLLGTVIDKGTVDPDAKYFENLGETTLTTLLTTYMLKAITGGYVSDINQIKNKGQYKDYYTKETLNDDSQKWLKEAESIIQENNTTNLQQNGTNNQNNANSQQVTQAQQKNAQNGISKQTEKRYIIDEKVNEYIQQNKDNFNTNINIDTKVVNDGELIETNYKNAKETAIYQKAKNLFNKIGLKQFKNNNDTIYVTNQDIKESIRKTIKNPSQKRLINENIAVFSSLDKIINNANELDVAQEHKDRSKYNSWKYYISEVNIDNKPYVVEFDTVLREDGQRHFRLERVYDINNTGDSKTTLLAPNANEVVRYGISFY